MTKKNGFAVVLFALVGMLAGVVQAQTTYTWANSNVSNIPSTNDWLTGGSNPQGAWSVSPGAQGSSLITNADTVQFFANTTTALTNTVAVVQNSNVNNGGTAVQLGTLTLSGRGSSTANANFTMNLSGDALNFSAATGTVNLNALLAGRFVTYNVANNIQLGTASSATALTFTGNGDSAFNFNGNITSLQAGSSSLTKSGSSILVLSGINTFNGITLNGGNLRAGNNSTSSGNDNFGAAGSTISVTGSSTISYGAGVSYAFDKKIDIASGVTLTFVKSAAGSHTYQGVLSGGNNTTVLVNDAGSIAQRTLDFSNTANTFTGTIDLQSNNSTVSFSSLGDASGAGNMKFGMNAGRSGAFIFGSGAVAPLVLSNRKIEIIAGASASGTASIYNNATAHTLKINSDLLVTGTGGTKTLELRGTNTGSNTFDGVIANGGLTTLSLTKNDAGSWIVSNTNNTYTGVTSISGGTLEVTKLTNGDVASSIGTSSSAASNLKLGGWASLRYTGSGDSTDRNFTIASTAHDQGFILDASGTGAINFTSTASPVYSASNYKAILTLSGTSTANNTLAAVVANNGANLVKLEKAGIGTWVLLNESTCTGGTTIKGGGTLVLDYSTPGSKLLDTAWLTLSGGTLTLKGGTGLTEVVAGTSVSAGATFITRDGGDTVLQLNALSQSAGGSISFLDGTVAKTSTANNGSGMFGAWATVGNNFACNDGTGKIVAYSGATTALPSTGAGSGSTNYTLSGGQTQTGTADLSMLTLKITGTGVADNTLALGGTNLRITNNADNNEGGILYIGGGTGIYNITANTGKGIYTSNTSRDLTINTVTGTLQINATLGSSQTSATLLKAGAGTLVLSSANTYTSTTYVNEGALRLANNTAAGTTAGGIQVQNGAALELSNNITVGAEALTLVGSGVSNGGALRNESGNNTYDGAITIGNDGARINSASGSLTLTGGMTISSFATLTFGGAGDITITNFVISTAGNLVKDGTGTLEFVVTNSSVGSSVGSLALNGGKLKINFNVTPSTTVPALTVSGDLTIDDTATLAISLGDGVTLGDDPYPLFTVGGSAPTAVPTLTGLSGQSLAWGGTDNKTLLLVPAAEGTIIIIE